MDGKTSYEYNVEKPIFYNRLVRFAISENKPVEIRQ